MASSSDILHPIQIEEIESNQSESTTTTTSSSSSSDSEFDPDDEIDGGGDAAADVYERGVGHTPFPDSSQHTHNGAEGGMADSRLLSSIGQTRDLSDGGECSKGEVDGLICIICMQAWSNDGQHCVCCLPCGHLYGMSCIKKWLKHSKNMGGKCPQCNTKCALKDVRKLYASQIVAIDEDSTQNVKTLESKCTFLEEKCSILKSFCRYLEEKCESLEEKHISYEILATKWSMKENEWRNKEIFLQQMVQQLTNRTTYLQQLLGDPKSRPLGYVDFEDGSWGPSTPGYISGSNSDMMRTTCSFTLRDKFELKGARNFDIDASNSIAIVAGRIPGNGGLHYLSKMSLVVPHDSDHMNIPSTTKVIKDVRISPNGGLALLASLGKKLHILSMGTNNVVLCYDLPAAAWSCAWDLQNSNILYAGLQNGSLVVFDMRMTAVPVDIMKGLTSNPVHTLCCTISSTSSNILSASSAGVLRWVPDGHDDKGAEWVEEAGRKDGVCIAVAANTGGERIVVSFRKKIEEWEEAPCASQQWCTQPSSSSPSSSSSSRVKGTHLLLEEQRLHPCCFEATSSTATTVDSVRLPKAVVVDSPDGSHLFASTDSHSLLHHLPSFSPFHSLTPLPGPGPLRDLKSSPPGILACLSDDALHLFSSLPTC